MSSTSSLTATDIDQIFTHQQTAGPFQLFSIITSGLNYLDGLNRTRLDPLCPPAQRTQALRAMVRLEGKLYQYIQNETPISYFDADFERETKRYILSRQLFLEAKDFTFKRHRFRFLCQLLQLYSEDPCNILPERDVMRQKLEQTLWQEYILLDMGLKNTEDIGREAISNGYHECDYTLDIEDVWKQPTKAIPPSHLRYVIDSLRLSNYARGAANYLLQHSDELRPARWVVDVTAIEEAAQQPIPPLTSKDIDQLKAIYNKK